jgi:hypothetical protein
MRTGKHHFTRVVVVVLAGLTIGVATAQASGQSPDSRPYFRGTDPALAPKSASPDDRSFNRATAVSPRTIIASPDDRSFARSASVVPRVLQASVSVRPRGFAWGDAMIGGSFGFCLTLLGAGAVAIALHHRRGLLRTA